MRRRRALCRSADLSSSASVQLQYNWLWQPRTWQQWERWRGSSEHRCVVLQRRAQSREGHESPQATNLCYGSVSKPICHSCPCHTQSAWWLAGSHMDYLKIHCLFHITELTCPVTSCHHSPYVHHDLMIREIYLFSFNFYHIYLKKLYPDKDKNVSLVFIDVHGGGHVCSVLSFLHSNCAPIISMLVLKRELEVRVWASADHSGKCPGYG